jgi:glycogen(starch) synthase
MNRPKVLMLGWEFPPIVNGGLGVACLGLSKALAKKTELTMILPKADPDFIVDNVDLIGLNTIDINKLKKVKTSKKYKEFASVYTVDSNILPYETPKLNILNSLRDTNPEADLDFELSQMNQFGKGDLYGDDLINKVIDYAKYVSQLATKIEFDIIHCHDWMTILAGVEIKKLSKKPLVLHIHSLEYDRGGPQSQGWVFQLEKYGMQQADIVIPVSNYTGQVIKEHYKIKSEKIIPVHNGADKVETYREEKPFPDKLVLYLGRITGQKGPQYFLDIASRVVDAYPNVRFVMAGTGDRLKGLIETGAYKRIGNKLHFTGFLSKEKVRHLLAMGDAYVMPSVSEPFGLSALEAAQFGVPCVISNQSGVAEVLKSALTADYWDTELMASHIISLLNDDSLKKKIVQGAYNDLANSTWDTAAEKVRAVYDIALAVV